ncbi:MAG: pyridoxal-phosphate dependent enzyme [Arcicella sp.]|nr:pyridoxal-phosphate dependent enzyme [Arcicella sp.]
MFHLPPSPLQLINDPILSKFNIKLYIKRDDLIHPDITGNKWRKLKYNLLEARRLNFDTLLTFGGAYSNHIAATAVAGKHFGFKTIGLIRGQELKPTSNRTLLYATLNGMDLIFLQRLDYGYKDRLTREYKKDHYVLPEGGTNKLAIKGVVEMVDEIYAEMTPDYICCAVGTGGTLAGIVNGLRGDTKAMGILVLKDDIRDLVTKAVQKLIPENTEFELIKNDYHFGNYGKTTPELIGFIKEFEKRNPDIQLEQVYTGKMMFGIYDMIQKGKFKENSTVVVIHTGGLQGRSDELDR